jgi:ferredoxin, 2Fe-2S
VIRITFVEFNGIRREVVARRGTSLMRAAVDNHINGIDGDCGGQCGCATCHVYIDPVWLASLKGRTEPEAQMLELSEGTQANSRLGCQITLGDELDGLVVHIPQGQQ